MHSSLAVTGEGLPLGLAAILAPIGKQKHYPALEAAVIHAYEQGRPKNRKRIDWKLITDLPIQSLRDAVEKLQWYSLRWKSELFHKILKSGLRSYDEPEILPSSTRPICLVSADGGQFSILPRSG